MSRRILMVLLVMLLVFGLLVSLPGAAGAKGHKQRVCHQPPGNPNNFQNIEVSMSAVPAHLAHGDSLGFCF